MHSQQRKRLSSLISESKIKLSILLILFIVFQNHFQKFLIALSAKFILSELSNLLSSTFKKQLSSPQRNLLSKLANNGKLTSNKYKKRVNSNLCLYYRARDHKLDSCPKKQTPITPKVHKQLLLPLQLQLLKSPQKNRKLSLRLCTD